MRELYTSEAFIFTHPQEDKKKERKKTVAFQAFAIVDSHERCFCVWVRERARLRVIVGSLSSRNQEQAVSRAEVSTTAVAHFCYAGCCCVHLLTPYFLSF